MATGGNAIAPTGDVFGGKNYTGWQVVSQDPLAGAHGRTVVSWAWAVDWAAGDNCHTIIGGHITINGTDVYNVPGTVHAFNSGHVHTGVWPPLTVGGFGAGTFTIDHDSSGNATITVNGAHIGTSGPLSASSGTWDLPQIPQTVAVPTACSASRVSDSQATVTWTNHSTSTAPYDKIKVYRSTNGGSYALIATLGVTTTYTDNTISADHKYVYRVSAVGKNTVEVGYATASAIWTTPDAPTSCVAAKQANDDVLVTWSNHVGYSEYTTRIEESVDGGAFSEIDSVSGGVSSYTAVAPDPAHTHRYRVRARSNTGSLNSGYSTSGTVTLLATANPPTGLSPSGVAVDAANDITLTWTHNPADGTPQSKRRVQYKIDAGSYTDLVNDSSGVSSYTITGGTLANGHTVTWKVATAGQNGTLSGDSAESTFTTRDAPTVAISAPSATYDTSQLVVDWAYFQAQSSAQATWTAQLLDAGGSVLETLSGTTEASATFATTLLDSTTYTVTVTVTSADSLTSVPGTQEFTTAFLPPAAVQLAASYDSGSGSTVLTVTGDAAVEGVTEEISTVDIQRSLDGGLTWVTFATGIALGLVDEVLTANVLDTRATIHGQNTYRAVAFSALPSSVMSSTVDVVTSEVAWSFVNYGPGFGSVCRGRTSLALAEQIGLDKALYEFADRELPVELSGKAVRRTVTVSVMLFEGASTVEEWRAAAVAKGPVLFRDPTGGRFFASMGTVRPNVDTSMPILSDGRVGAAISFDLTQVDYQE